MKTLESTIETPNLVIAPGESGGGWDDVWGGFDYGDLGGGGFYGDYGDFGTTASSYQDDVYISPDIQQVIITGERMTLWEKAQYDAENAANVVGGAIDSALTTFGERGYVTIGYANYVGVYVTMDMSNHDIYIGVTAGRAGPIAAIGLTPEGMSQNDFLSGWGGGVTLPTPAGGVGVATSGGNIAPAYGLPGQGVTWAFNASQATSYVAEQAQMQMVQVINQAGNYFNYAMGVPSGGGGGTGGGGSY